MRGEQLRFFAAISILVSAGCASFTPPKPYDATEAIKQRSRVTGASAYQNHPETLVGRIISIKKNATGTCETSTRVFDTWTLSRVPLVKAAQPAPGQKPNVIYQRHIEGQLSANGTFPFVSVAGTGDGAVELVVTDLAESIGGANIDQNAVDAIARATWPTDVCARFLIENVVSSLALYKRHTRVTSKSNIVGTAFGINNEVYNSDEEFKSEALIFVDLNVLEKPGVTPLVKVEKDSRPSIQLVLPANASLQVDDL